MGMDGAKIESGLKAFAHNLRKLAQIAANSLFLSHYNVKITLIIREKYPQKEVSAKNTMINKIDA